MKVSENTAKQEVSKRGLNTMGRFPVTMDLIRQLFPGTEFSQTRYELYRLMYSIPLNKLPQAVTMMDFKPESDKCIKELEDFESDQLRENLLNIQTSLVEERKGMVNLRTMVRIFCFDPQMIQPFSAHDITDAIRAKVNNSRLVLLDDRDYEDLEISPGVTGLTQRIPHDEVRSYVVDLFGTGELTRENAGDHYVYSVADRSTPIATGIPLIAVPTVKQGGTLDKDYRVPVIDVKNNSLLSWFNTRKK